MAGARASVCGFNPTLVRLRPGLDSSSPGTGQAFQSHAGSIEASSLQGTSQLRACFNPTLVRLRLELYDSWSIDTSEFQSHAGSIEAQDNGAQATSRSREFQSHAGSIEALKRIGVRTMKPRFNPTLVRLRLFTLDRRFSKWFQFQSHAGSIEAGQSLTYPMLIPNVSIPRWFD